VKWHDGCPFTADDVVWNFGYSGDEKAPQFNPAQFAQARAFLGTYAGVEKVDDHTVAFATKVPDALFPYMMSFVMMVPSIGIVYEIKPGLIASSYRSEHFWKGQIGRPKSIGCTGLQPQMPGHRIRIKTLPHHGLINAVRISGLENGRLQNAID
jgi:ABC-type transport system substrate-binding protein